MRRGAADPGIFQAYDLTVFLYNIVQDMETGQIDVWQCSILELAALIGAAVDRVAIAVREHDHEASASAVEAAVLEHMRSLSPPEWVRFLADPFCSGSAWASVPT